MALALRTILAVVAVVALACPAAGRQLKVDGGVPSNPNTTPGPVANPEATLRNIGATISALIYNELRGNDIGVRNGIYAELASTRAGTSIVDLKVELSAIISNVIIGNENIADNVISVLLGNNAFIERLDAAVEAFAINDINGAANEAANIQWYDLVGQNGGDNILKNLFLEISGLTYNKIGDATGAVSGDNNELLNTLGVYTNLGSNANNPNFPTSLPFNEENGLKLPGGIGDMSQTNMTVIVDAILLNEVISGSGNYLENFMSISVANGVDITNVKAEIEAILVNQIEGDDNKVSNIMDIVLGLCDGRPCGMAEFDMTVSAIMLNDISGKNNIIDNTIKIVAGTNSDVLAAQSLDAIKRATLDIEAIIVNTLRSDLVEGIDSNELKNNIMISVLDSISVSDLKATISAIIANDVAGALNKLENSINIKIGMGRD